MYMYRYQVGQFGNLLTALLTTMLSNSLVMFTVDHCHSMYYQEGNPLLSLALLEGSLLRLPLRDDMSKSLFSLCLPFYFYVNTVHIHVHVDPSHLQLPSHLQACRSKNILHPVTA